MIEQFKQYIGIPFKLYGRDLNGWDCIGMVLYFKPHLRELDMTGYDMFKDGELLQERLNKLQRRIGKPQPMDILAFSLYNNGLPTHLGIYVGNNRFLHVLYKRKTTLPRLNFRYKQSLLGVYYG